MDLVTLDQVHDALNFDGDTSHDIELQLYIDAVTAHFESVFGSLSSATYTEIVSADRYGRIFTRHSPVIAVTSASQDSTSYASDFTVGSYVTHPSITNGSWLLTYEAGYAAAPADLQVAALEDIRGLYQPGQIGPVAAFGAFGAQSTDTGTTYRPVRMWPRVDAWLDSNIGSGVA